jgi:hypothetical protein
MLAHQVLSPRVFRPHPHQGAVPLPPTTQLFFQCSVSFRYPIKWCPSRCGRHQVLALCNTCHHQLFFPMLWSITLCSPSVMRRQHKVLSLPTHTVNLPQFEHRQVLSRNQCCAATSHYQLFSDVSIPALSTTQCGPSKWCAPPSTRTAQWKPGTSNTKWCSTGPSAGGARVPSREGREAPLNANTVTTVADTLVVVNWYKYSI